MSNKKVQGFLTILGIIILMLAMGYLSFFGLTINDKTSFSFRNIKQGLDLKGGVYIVFEAENPTSEAMKISESIIRRRLDDKGYLEATVSIQGSNRLRVEIPDVEDADAAVEDMGKTALLEFRDEEGNLLVSGSEVQDASAQRYEENVSGQKVMSYGVRLVFDKEGADKFAKATEENIGRRIVIYLDGSPISAPTVHQKIIGEASITGEFTAEEAQTLASLIKSGALPTPLKVIEQNRVGAQLGADALSGSIKAGIVGTILVLLFMVAVYRLSGLAADIALCFFIVAEILFLSVFKVTLTLPGIAGIILTVGMAVDANVIIFERMKEELTVGKTIRTSIESGFSRALPAILDGNITTLIAACVLFGLGTGPIKGFAQTLIIGVIISMITALFVTRALMIGIQKMGLKNKSLLCSVNIKQSKEAK